MSLSERTPRFGPSPIERRSEPRTVNQVAFVNRLSDFSRQLPERVAIVDEATPKFFKNSGEEPIKYVLAQTQAMYDRSLQKILKDPKLIESVKLRVKALSGIPDYDVPAKELIADLEKKGVNPYHLELLQESVLSYLSSRRTIGFIEKLGKMEPHKFRSFFVDGNNPDQQMQIQLNRLTAARHFERFARFFAHSNEYENLKFELERYDREIDKTNHELKIDGLDHHFLITKKPAFGSVEPSVNGGDTLHLARVDLPNGRHLLFGSLVDIAGHAEVNSTKTNNSRNLVMGLAIAAIEHTDKSTLTTVAGQHHFIQTHSALLDRIFDANGLNGSAFHFFYNPEQGTLHWISQGHPLPELANPVTGVRKMKGTRSVFLGAFPQNAEEYVVNQTRLKPGDVVNIQTDVLKEHGKEYHLGADDHFAELVRKRLSAEQIAQGLVENVLQKADGAPFDDDGRILILRRLGENAKARPAAKSPAKIRYRKK